MKLIEGNYAEKGLMKTKKEQNNWNVYLQWLW